MSKNTTSRSRSRTPSLSISSLLSSPPSSRQASPQLSLTDLYKSWQHEPTTVQLPVTMRNKLKNDILPTNIKPAPRSSQSRLESNRRSVAEYKKRKREELANMRPSKAAAVSQQKKITQASYSSNHRQKMKQWLTSSNPEERKIAEAYKQRTVINQQNYRDRQKAKSKV